VSELSGLTRLSVTAMANLTTTSAPVPEPPDSGAVSPQDQLAAIQADFPAFRTGVIVYVYVHGRHMPYKCRRARRRWTWTRRRSRRVMGFRFAPGAPRTARNDPERGRASPGTRGPSTAILTCSSASEGPSWDGTLRHCRHPEGSVTYPFQRLPP